MRAFQDSGNDAVKPLLIPAKHAVRMLGISERYLYTLAKRGEIKVRRFGRKVMFPIAEVERLAADPVVDESTSTA